MIVKMYDRFSSIDQISLLKSNDQKFFLEFAKAWPKFMKNNAIMQSLTQIEGSQIKVEDQSETLSILTQKNVLFPDLIQEHFVQFMRLKDKDSVANYLRQFLKSSAYFGYTSNIDMEQVTQVFRRIHKQPEHVEMSELLDFLTTLVISNAYYKDFDVKSQAFVVAAIDLVEETFTGTSHLTALRKNEKQEEEEFKLFFFNQIPSDKKVYNKILKKNLPKWEQNYIAGGKQEYFRGSDSSSELDIEDDIDLDDEVKTAPLGQAASADLGLTREEDDLGIDEDAGDTMSGLEEVVEEEEIIEQAAPEDREKKSYDRKASGGTSHHDFEYEKFRNKKFEQMDKKEKHLLLYSNVNQKNFVDINT